MAELVGAEERGKLRVSSMERGREGEAATKWAILSLCYAIAVAGSRLCLASYLQFTEQKRGNGELMDSNQLREIAHQKGMGIAHQKTFLLFGHGFKSPKSTPQSILNC
jgi:hypothetical protein